MSQSKDTRKRMKLAKTLERATVVEQNAGCRGHAYLVHPTITRACRPSLQRIAASLRDENHPVAPSTLDALRAFVCDGNSPFFGRSLETAYDEVVALEALVQTVEWSAPASSAARAPTAAPGRVVVE